MDIWAELRERGDVIRQHWWTFALSVALGAVLAFIAASYVYAARIETVEAANEFLRDRLESGLPAIAPIPATGASLPWPTIGLGLLAAVVVIGLVSLLVTSVRAVRRRKNATPSPAPVHRGPENPVSSQPVSAPAKSAPVRAAGDPLQFLDADLRPARPQVEIKSVVRDQSPGMVSGGQIRALLHLSNVTATALPRCSILVHSVTADGVTTLIHARIVRGKDRQPEFAVAAKSAVAAIVGYRNFETAPYQEFRVNADPPNANALSMPEPITLADNTTSYLNVIADSGEGVETRAVIELKVGEYEELEVKLLDQSSWHQSR